MSESCPKCKGKGGTEYYTDTIVRCYECQGTGVMPSNPTDSIDQILLDLAGDLMAYEERMSKTGVPNVRFVHEYNDKAKKRIESLIQAARLEGQKEALDVFEHRIDCNTVISELYGWRSIVERSKEQASRVLNNIGGKADNE